MTDRCGVCSRSLRAMQVYRRKGETYRPGSFTATVPRTERDRRTVCMECFKALTPDEKRSYALVNAGARLGES